ncbi:hypothetical protein Sta7437_1974 [Stanieria cyanosphaera PCC 7437]|uniref:Nitrate reductase associated protein n=2 Tax=Stanieria cyanosphaera TaxID=102116 RepID=K9XSL1_STAC7|nr:hypothetical protein Sta7437_1974 [Stanieria cyanosphaera PCC 7437]
MTNNQFFQFEADFVESLRCIPMQVRIKLDTCGVKLKLSHWHQFDQQERQALVSLPCSTETEAQKYREFLQNLVQEKSGAPAGELPLDPHPAWLDQTSIPQDLQTKLAESNLNITIEQWSKLTPVQRFALIKLSRPSHENKNFLPALKEFQLI